MTEPLPEFSLARPTSVEQALATFATNPSSRFLAGGTDLLVNMRRGLVEAGALVDLAGIPEMSRLEHDDTGLVLGAGVTLRQIAENPKISSDFGAIARAAATVAGPGHRAMATIGGNLCLDTRCLYFNQSHWWRRANDFCLKFKGETCHVAPTGERCRAAFSGDLAPALMVHDAVVEIAGPDGRRRLALADLYREDGADHLTLKPGELVVAVRVPPARPAEVRSDYAKVRIRGAIDFPLAGAAVAYRKLGPGGHRFTIAVTGTNSAPVPIVGPMGLSGEDDADTFFFGLEKLVQKQVSPQRTTATAAHYRRLSVSALARRLARDLWAGWDQSDRRNRPSNGRIERLP